jgi:hypothetical protein
MPRLQDEVLIVTCHVDIQANDFITDGWQKKRKKKEEVCGLNPRSFDQNNSKSTKTKYGQNPFHILLNRFIP